MTGREALAAEFDGLRPRLRSVAYRMLGSLTEAEDAVQESWFRLDRTQATIDDLQGWLTTVVGRISLDMLRARRSRPAAYEGAWLPEPVVDDASDPEHAAVLAESVGLALLVVLETLGPDERVAFVLHDVFAVPFDAIATIVGSSPAAARQLASRGRRRVREAARTPDVDLATQQRVVTAFLEASRAGDFEALLALLDPEVVFRSDGGGTGPLARPPVSGARDVAEMLRTRGPVFAAHARPVVVNGGAGVMVDLPGVITAIIGFTVVGGRIAAIDLIADPEKLRGTMR